MDMFKPKPVQRVQDAKGDTGPEKIYSGIIGDDETPIQENAEVMERIAPKKPSIGVVKIELSRPSCKTGQEISGKVSVKMNNPTNCESLVIAVWGQKLYNLPAHFKTTGGNNDSKIVFVSQRSIELANSKVFDKEETLEFKLPVVSPVPDVAANYKWYVGASLLSGQDELSDLIEIRVAD